MTEFVAVAALHLGHVLRLRAFLGLFGVSIFISADTLDETHRVARSIAVTADHDSLLLAVLREMAFLSTILALLLIALTRGRAVTRSVTFFIAIGTRDD